MSKVISSGKNIIVGSFISKGVSVITSIILARLLFTEDYGALVLSGIFSGLISQLSGMGYELYYLKSKLNEVENQLLLDQVFNLRLITNFIMSLVQSIIGLILYVLYDDKVSGGILIMMGVSLCIEGFSSPHETLLKKDLNFKKITLGNILKETFSSLGKVGSAAVGLGGLCFGVGAILGSIARVVYLFKVQKYRPRYLKWNTKIIKEIFAFSKHVLFGSAGMYMVQQIDRILLTSLYPTNIVGQYGFAWGNASMPFNYLVSPQSQLILTYITKHEIGEKKLFYKLLIVQKLITVILFPVMLIGIVYTEPIINLLFGEKWIIVVDLVKVLLLYYAVVSILFPYNSLLTGLGFANINSKIVFARAIILLFSLSISYFMFNASILTYTMIFCSVSILFDIIKACLGIFKLDVTINEILSVNKANIINFAILFCCIILSVSFLNNYLNIFLVVGTLICFILTNLIFEKKISYKAINLMLKREKLI